MEEMKVNNIKVTLIRKYNNRGPWRNEYYFQVNYGPGNALIANLMEVILPHNVLLTKGQLEYLTKMLNTTFRLNRAKKGTKSR